ncbi:MAG TPA: hypothetical protein VG711_08505, partial [Phycisphaerales bacterium]|nr:hypothetical protein [Phycisphaerales bacterium]
GGVKFDGAVYTTVHGPQPTTEGEALYTAGDAGWEVRKGDKPVDMKTVWKGYKFEDGHVVFMYDLKAGDAVINVEEQPEVTAIEGDKVTLERAFHAHGIPNGMTVRLNFGEPKKDYVEKVQVAGSPDAAISDGHGESMNAIQLLNDKTVGLIMHIRIPDAGHAKKEGA